MELKDLKHTYVPLPKGGEIIVLDNGALIDAEAEAMLQALHSRSTGGLRAHLKVLEEKGADNFMKNFYVGYGHKSIGDCGTTTVFIEGVSMLAAKAIQDFPLYSGQEASTRYIDFSQQPFINPSTTTKGSELLEFQRSFYMSAQEPTKQLLKQLHPMDEGEKESVYEKAIAARAFDITRSLLPAGAATNLAWHTNLRQAADRMLFLRHHPLPEVREIAEGLEEALKQHHPNSFGHKRYDETEAYQELIAKRYYFHSPKSPEVPSLDLSGLDTEKLKYAKELFATRPPKTELPKYLSQLGTVSTEFQLDFGSFRDIQRHRAISQRMPLLTTELGFNQWYIDNFPAEVKEKLFFHLELVMLGIQELKTSKNSSQYYIPMGYNTSNKFIGDLPSTIYMIELRDSRFVHPTLQKVAHSLGEQLSSKLSIPIHVDSDPGRFDIKRGKQDITIKA